MTHPPDGCMVIVDDDERFRERFASALQSRGIRCAAAADAPAAYELIDTLRPDRILLDLRMPRISGLDAIPEIRRRAPDATIVVLTGFGSIATAVEALRRGADDYLVKPIDVDQALAAFDRRQREAPAAIDERAEPPTLGRMEWEHIQRVLNECGGNISRAARALGMHRRSLQRKLNKYPPER